MMVHLLSKNMFSVNSPAPPAPLPRTTLCLLLLFNRAWALSSSATGPEPRNKVVHKSGVLAGSCSSSTHWRLASFHGLGLGLLWLLSLLQLLFVFLHLLKVLPCWGHAVNKSLHGESSIVVCLNSSLVLERTPKKVSPRIPTYTQDSEELLRTLAGWVFGIGLHKVLEDKKETPR